jgi:hypothetical protein
MLVMAVSLFLAGWGMARAPAGRTALRGVWATGSYQVTSVRLACRWWPRPGPTGQPQGTRPDDSRVRPGPRPPRGRSWWLRLGSTGQEQGTQPAESRVRPSPQPPPESSQRNHPRLHPRLAAACVACGTVQRRREARPCRRRSGTAGRCRLVESRTWRRPMRRHWPRTHGRSSPRSSSQPATARAASSWQSTAKSRHASPCRSSIANPR